MTEQDAPESNSIVILWPLSNPLVCAALLECGLCVIVGTWCACLFLCGACVFM